jgi:hypothetical protein
MKSEIKTHSIKELLNASTMQVAPATLEKLRTARTRALERQRTRHSVPVLAWLGQHSGRNDSFHKSRSLNWGIALLFVAFLISGASFWQNYSTEHEISEVDIAILTDDLPIHIYVD